MAIRQNRHAPGLNPRDELRTRPNPMRSDKQGLVRKHGRVPAQLRIVDTSALIRIDLRVKWCSIASYV